MLLDVIEELAGKHHRLRTVLLTSLMVVVGIVCLIMPSVVAGYLSIIIGALMTLVGGAGVAFRLAGRFEEKTRGAGTSFVMATLGVVCIFYGDVSTNIIGVSWGLLGLYKVAGEYDEVVAKARRRKLDAVQLLLATAELGLSLLLIVNPLGSMEHHVVVLGIELILYPFKLHRDNGRLSIDDES